MYPLRSLNVPQFGNPCFKGYKNLIVKLNDYGSIMMSQIPKN